MLMWIVMSIVIPVMMLYDVLFVVLFMFLCFMWNLLEQVSLEKEINDLNGIHLGKINVKK